MTRAQSAAQEEADMDEATDIAFRYLQAWGELPADEEELAEESQEDSSQFKPVQAEEDAAATEANAPAIPPVEIAPEPDAPEYAVFEESSKRPVEFSFVQSSLLRAAGLREAGPEPVEASEPRFRFAQEERRDAAPTLELAT
jgi:hypothetical protein